jgi:hypothetical protein
MAISLSDRARRLIDGANPGVLGTVNPDGSRDRSVDHARFPGAAAVKRS